MRRKSLAVHLDLARDLPKVSIDVDRINQVIYNLLNNAIRYIEAGCMITVSTLAVTVKGQPYVQVQIADTGSGIAPEDLQHIFQYFYRSENRGTARAAVVVSAWPWLSSSSAVMAEGYGRTVKSAGGRRLPLFYQFIASVGNDFGKVFRRDVFAGRDVGFFPSKSTVTAVTPSIAANASCTCFWQCWHIIPSIFKVFPWFHPLLSLG